MQLQLRGLNFPIQSHTKPSLACVVMFLSSLLSSSLSPDPTSIFQGRENIKVSHSDKASQESWLSTVSLNCNSLLINEKRNQIETISNHSDETVGSSESMLV